MTQKTATPSNSIEAAQLSMVLDSNLGLPVDHGPIAEVLKAFGVTPYETSDPSEFERLVTSHEADIAFIPSGMYHRLFSGGDRHYRGLALSTSKFSGDVTMTSLLVVRRDDDAASIDDLKGSRYGFINKVCSSTYYPAEILLQRQGRALADFLDIQTVSPGATWEGLVDAVTSGTVRATMVLEDVWRTFPRNADTTKVIGRYTQSKGPVVLARADLDRELRERLLEVLLDHAPPWEAVYGGLKPFYQADMTPWFHDLDGLPKSAW